MTTSTKRRPQFKPVPEQYDSTEHVFFGFAAVYGSAYDHGGEVEEVCPGSFNHILDRRRTIMAMVEHDRKRYLGSTKDGRLRLLNTDFGLAVCLEAPPGPDAEEVASMIRRGECG